MIPFASVLALSLLPGTTAAPAGPAGSGPAALERLLRGTWVGGDCGGELTLRANGTFARRHYGPDNQALSGTWKVRWDALPPTLVLTCTDADWAGEIGTVREVKVVQLDAAALSYQWPGVAEPARYTRPKK
jgi:hypothetical protein